MSLVNQTDVTLDDFNEQLAVDGLVVVDFSALAWCVPCKRLHPHFEAVAEKMPEVTFLLVDVDTADRQLLDLYSVSGVPTVLAFKDGEQVATITERTGPKLVQEITTLL